MCGCACVSVYMCALVSLDVNSIYKIIPKNKGIETIYETLNIQQNNPHNNTHNNNISDIYSNIKQLHI